MKVAGVPLKTRRKPQIIPVTMADGKHYYVLFPRRVPQCPICGRFMARDPHFIGGWTCRPIFWDQYLRAWRHHPNPVE